MLNHIMKTGSATANTLGSIAVIYSAFGVILSYARGADDDLNTIAAATATGCLYKSTGMSVTVYFVCPKNIKVVYDVNLNYDILKLFLFL